MAKILIFAFLIIGMQTFAQNLTPAQMVQVQAAQASGGLQAADIAAAKEILSAQNTETSETASNNVDDVSSLVEEADEMAFTAHAGLKKIARYESIIFSRSLPSTFYEVQGIVPADYPLKPGDNLELSLWGAVEKQFPLFVNNQGNVFVEGVGLINIANLNLGEAEKLITKKLQNVYSGIVQGRISVNLRTTKLSPTKVFVMGSVQRPGGYDLPGNANVFLALYRAGGSDEYGSVRNIIVRRANGDSAKIDLYDFLLKGQKIGEGILRDGDLIFIPKAEKLVKANGAIGKPAIYELKNGETLSDLLAFAGGLLPNTDHTINLWRINDLGSQEVFEPGLARDFTNGKKEFQMQNGDSIFVFASTRPGNNFIQIIGSVFYPGYYTWAENMLIKDAVVLAGGLSSEAYLKRAIVERLNSDSTMSYFSDDFNGTKNFNLLPGDKVIILDSRVLRNWRTVSVTGHVKKPRNFEWQENLNALDLIALCGGFLPNATKSEIMVERLIVGKQETEIINLQLKNELSVSNNNIFLKPGDRVIVKADTSYYEPEVVILAGAFKNPGSYSLAKRGESFKNLMKRIAIIDTTAFIKGGLLYRKVLKTTSLSTDATSSSYRMNFDFERVLQGKDKDIELQAGDSIYVPFEMLTVNIIGEVTSPGHVLWQKGWDIDDYLNAAGGLTITGDEKRIVLSYANGQKTKAAKAKRDPDPGSIIQVYSKPAPEPIKWTEVVSAIGTLATAFAAITLAAVKLL